MSNQAPANEMMLQARMQSPSKSNFQRNSSGSVPAAVPFQRKQSSGGISSVSFQRTGSNVSGGSSAGASTGQNANAAIRKEVQALTPEQTEQLLAKCTPGDKVLYVARRLMGGSTINGFLKATASAQRIKKQRARQVEKSSKKSETGGGGANPADTSGKRKRESMTEQEQEEDLKNDIMNVRTAKKIQSELSMGVDFCVALHSTVLNILGEMEPNGSHPKRLRNEKPASSRSAPPPTMTGATSSGKQRSKPPQPQPSKPPQSLQQSQPSQSKAPQQQQHSAAAASPSSPGDPNGSTLRRLRKKKSSSSSNPSTTPSLDEFDASGKRLFSKKEHVHRILEIIRFRGLKQGDYVAARTSSRDLWILARVLKDFSAIEMPHADFLKLSEAKRDSLFRGKVQIKDVEEKDGSNAMSVARRFVLPLPRSYGEASEWGARCKKGSRVYAMYPMTTSLYSATVIDNTTYCRGEDDIIVVEFDGDEADAKGAMPQYHIPARFVTPIPREFPSSQVTKSKKKSALLPPKSSSGSSGSKRSSSKKSRSKEPNNNNDHDEALNDMISEMAYGDFTTDATGLENFEEFDSMEDLGVAQHPPPMQHQAASANRPQMPPPPNAAMFRNNMPPFHR